MLLHSVHADSSVVVSLSDSKVEPSPAPHFVWSSHTERSLIWLNFLSALVQVSHPMSVVAEPSVDLPWPAGHLDHAVQVAALYAVEYCPEEHAVQVSASIMVPGVHADVGALVGASVGASVGALVGEEVGDTVGAFVGALVGDGVVTQAVAPASMPVHFPAGHNEHVVRACLAL